MRQDFNANSPNGPTDGIAPNPPNAFEGDISRISPLIPRLPPVPLGLAHTQSAPAFLSASRALPPALITELSGSPVHSPPVSNRSPIEDGGSAIRLPSITRQGFLVDGVARPQGQIDCHSEAPPQRPGARRQRHIAQTMESKGLTAGKSVQALFGHIIVWSALR